MALTPNKKRLIISIVAVIMWYLVFFLMSFGRTCPNTTSTCTNQFPKLVPSCGSCFDLTDFLTQILLIVFFPFVLVFGISLKVIKNNSVKNK
jgi:hypothetical protein